jgi:pimeloyl-ACP methyl ester carboxylesterase
MPHPTPKPSRHPETVDPAWLLKAIGITILIALLCAWLTLNLLFYRGQWQLVLHPARTTSAPANIAGAPYELIHFGLDESATPQLTGWWIPAPANARYAQSTILFLPGADGSLANSTPTLAALHNLGINVFAFDYRGYGQSADTHPSQEKMTQDANHAWQYLNTSRNIPAHQIIPYGSGVGSSLATNLALTHPDVPALILDSPQADLLDTALRDPRTTLLPARLLFHERFPLTDLLAGLRTPKLLISTGTSAHPAFRTAADPKLTVDLSSPTDPFYGPALTRFLDAYLPSANQQSPSRDR